MPGEVFGECRSLRITEHPLDLRAQHGGIGEFVLRRECEEFVVRHRAPEAIGEPRRQRVVVEQDEKVIIVYPADIKAKGDPVQRADVKSIAQSPVSQMPPGLINSLSEKELRELTAYIMSGGNPRKNRLP